MTAIHKTPTRKTIASAISLALATTALAQTSTALAQQLVLEEVIVTAQKRAQSLQDVPISVAAMTGDKIDDTGIGSGTNAGFEQSVGMYIDGVYAGRGPLAAVPTTMDLERVEILKGPQGTLFGKNTIAGAINITTANGSNITIPLSPGGQDLTDETLLFAPEWSANLNAQYVVPIGDSMETHGLRWPASKTPGRLH